MTKQDALNMAHALNALQKERLPVRCAYAVAKNLARLRETVESVQAAAAPSQGFQDYEKARVALVRQYADLDDKGEPIADAQGHARIRDMPAFLDALAVLRGCHQEAITEQDARAAEVEDLLREECAVELHRVALDQFPAEIQADTMRWLLPMVSEGEVSK